MNKRKKSGIVYIFLLVLIIVFSGCKVNNRAYVPNKHIDYPGGSGSNKTKRQSFVPRKDMQNPSWPVKTSKKTFVPRKHIDYPGGTFVVRRKKFVPNKDIDYPGGTYNKPRTKFIPDETRDIPLESNSVRVDPFIPNLHMSYSSGTNKVNEKRVDDIQYKGAYKYDNYGARYRKHFKNKRKREKKKWFFGLF